MLLRARILYPVSSPTPIENGAVQIRNGRIAEYGRFEDLARSTSDPLVDLGEQILMPGLVNAHCHLDYTLLARHIPPPSSFTDWVKQLITLKAGWSYSEFAESWIAGMHQLTDTGTTTVGDIEAVPELSEEVLQVARLRVLSFRELITVRSRNSGVQYVESAEQELAELHFPRHRVGLSPHAPYSTTQATVQAAATQARKHGWRWTMHLAESTEELAMFTQASGPMYEWLKAQRDMSDCGKGSPVEWLQSTGTLGPDLILVHANCVSESEAQSIGQSGAHVVHCPRSHHYFQHPRFPFEALRNAGTNICLGTDSLVSVRTTRGSVQVLSLFDEMRQFVSAYPQVEPPGIVHMATQAGAIALGLENETGSLQPGLSADLIALPFSGDPKDAADAIVHHQGAVNASLIGGEWLLRPRHLS